MYSCQNAYTNRPLAPGRCGSKLGPSRTYRSRSVLTQPRMAQLPAAPAARISRGLRSFMGRLPANAECRMSFRPLAAEHLDRRPVHIYVVVSLGPVQLQVPAG